MTMKNNYGRNNNPDIVLGNKFEKLNISQSEESFEEYTEKELNYIDKYKSMSMNRMTDEEIYEIIVKYDFNDEKIEREIKEFTKLIHFKGDDYGWNVIDKGNKKTLFLNETSKKEKTTKGNKNYNNYKSQNLEGGYYNYYQNGNYNSYNYKKNYNKNYQKIYNEENEKNKEVDETNINTTNELNSENKDTTEDLNSGAIYYKKNYYNNYNYNTRGYMRGRGRARGRGQMRGGRNYSYNYNNKEDIHKIIEKDLNTEEIIEINVEEAKERKEDMNNIEERNNLSQENKEQERDHQEKNKDNDKEKEKTVEDQNKQNTNVENNENNENTHKTNTSNVQINKFENTNSEKQNIFNNDNTNSSKLKNLIEDVETESIEKPTNTNTKKEEHNNKKESQQTRQQITYSKESQENINFGITGQQKKNEEHTISNASSFVFFSKPAQKSEQIINSQSESFNYTTQSNNNNNQNKFNNSNQPTKNQNQNQNSQTNNSQTQQINAIQNNSVKNNSQPSNINMNQQSINKPDLNMNQQGQQPQNNANNNPNSIAFNPLMGNQNMYFGMGGEGIYPGANSFQPGYMPYFWYYNPANQGVGNDPSVPQQPHPHNFPQNGGMPFVPYAMPYYINPMVYQQGETIKEDPTGKTRKNNFYTNPTGYPGINQTDSSAQQANPQSTPYTMPYFYNPAASGMNMNQMMGMNPNQTAWNQGINPMAAQMGMNYPMQQQMMPGYDPQNYQNIKNDQQNPNMYQYKYQN